jgi:CMP-N-acetylneuraminic acid synthetase
MYKNKKILGVITARGGSKGIPRKNIKKIKGKPLIWYTINASLKSKLLTKCIVSTEDPVIARISKYYGATVPFIRPNCFALDESKGIAVVQHALRWFKENESEEFDYLMILQPTSPLRKSKDIDACIKKIIDTDSDSIMSVYEMTDFSLEKLKKIENDMILPLIKDEGPLSEQRQNLDNVYKRNGAIYLTRTNIILSGDLFGEISRPYIMSQELSIDINTLTDLKFAEFLLKDND